MRRSLVVPLALAAVVTAAAPAAAASQTVYQRFWVTFRGEQNTSWEMPRHLGVTDCYHRRFHEARGEETWRLTSRQPTRVLAVVSDPVVDFRIGTWDPLEIVRNPYVRLRNANVRSRSERLWSEPGRCGGETTQQPIRDDCGSRDDGLKATFAVAPDRKFRLALGGDPPGKGMPFMKCPMLYPEGIAGGDFETPAVPGRPAAFGDGGQKSVAIGWSRTFKASAPPKSRPWSTTTEASWEVTFRRVGRPFRHYRPRPR